MVSTTVGPQTTLERENVTAPRPTTQMFVGCLMIPTLVVIALGAVMFRTWRNASANLIVPASNVLFARSAPQESAPLIARFVPDRPSP